MTRTTKADLAAQAARDAQENTLLRQYMDDQENRRAPVAETLESGPDGSTRARLWRPKAGHGGYVVLTEVRGGSPGVMGTLSAEIVALDAWDAWLREHPTEHNLHLRIIAERLTIARNGALGL